MSKIVVLASGGLDSTVTAAIAKSEGYELYFLTIDYGQRHRTEIECAQKISDYFEVKEHKIIPIGLANLWWIRANRSDSRPHQSNRTGS